MGLFTVSDAERNHYSTSHSISHCCSGKLGHWIVWYGFEPKTKNLIIRQYFHAFTFIITNYFHTISFLLTGLLYYMLHFLTWTRLCNFAVHSVQYCTVQKIENFSNLKKKQFVPNNVFFLKEKLEAEPSPSLCPQR